MQERHLYGCLIARRRLVSLGVTRERVGEAIVGMGLNDVEAAAFQVGNNSLT